MQKKLYVPERGDVVWLNFTPQAGHEQAGHRPALVLSPKTYNRRTGMMLCCPLTTQIKGYPFEVLIESRNVPGVALADQIKSMDWKARRAVYRDRAAPHAIDEVLAKARALLQP
jgi:mRNA interferase MazF